MSASQKAILEIDRISKHFGAFTAVDDVHFGIPEGSIFGLLGPNGAGKTTLIRLINRIYLPDQGVLRMEGRPLTARSVYRIGYLPEERGLYKKMKVGEQLLYLARLRGLSKQDARQRIDQWLERLDMGQWQNHRMQELSKGMQQKIQFIVTVIHEPRLLILDEPFTGFDPVNTQLIIAEMQRLRKEGATLILSTHRMESVEQLCTDLAMINNGRLVLEGPIREVRHRYKQHQYRIAGFGQLTQSDLACVPGAEVRFCEYQENQNYTELTVQLAGPQQREQLLTTAMQALEISEFREILPGMQDIFIQQVQAPAHV